MNLLGGPEKCASNYLYRGDEVAQGTNLLIELQCILSTMSLAILTTGYN